MFINDPSSPIPNVLEQIGALHAAYVEITGMEIRCDYARVSAWQEFIKRGFTLDDIKLVVFEIRRGISTRSRHVGALRFSNLIVNIEYFEEELAMARANMRSRRPPMTEKDKLLKQTGRATETTGTARTVGTVIQALSPTETEAGKRAREAFSKLGKSL